MLTLTKTQLARIDRWFIAALSIWFVAVAIFAWLGLYEWLTPRLILIPISVGIVVPITIYFRSESFRLYIQSISLKHLTLFHLWRIPAGLAFLYYGNQGWLPEFFTRNAGWGDLAVGVITPIVLMMPGDRGKYAAFHAFGLLDLMVALGTGVTFALTNVPLMENIASFPIVLIPMYGVAVTGSLSVMTLHRIVREYREALAIRSENEKVNEQSTSPLGSVTP